MVDHSPREILIELAEHADILFGNHKDASLLLDKSFSGDGTERRREAALALLDRFPKLKFVCSTARHIEGASVHRIEARIDARDTSEKTPEWLIGDIVDRIGTGDAFAAGVLHGWLTDKNDLLRAIDYGMRLMAYKHSVKGDSCTITRKKLEAVNPTSRDVAR